MTTARVGDVELGVGAPTEPAGAGGGPMRLRALGAWGLAGADDDAEAWSAWQWLQDRAADFLALGPQLYDLAHRASTVAAESRDTDPERYELARAAAGRIMDLWGYQQTLADRVRPIYQKAQGLSAWPWIYFGYTAAATVALVAGVSWVIARGGAERRIVELLEAGQLTPGEAERLLAETEGGAGSGLLGGATQLVTLIVLGALAWAVIRDRS